eukprot:CAMPEP_0172569516 /NCGR_PEP_ID=MMETSP1067-20121228/123797_1 /TAXON_ID=265564 ORGANISM="Thalassiosira punctigera, Strain Tpunct2005C2" /NCGR_SAMPLE_ID=MMETSP1067 /ASSEMBLY_ACC=CAM_ASM_000444 /LENGTH=176 /DNA_ID=CAMNT_0013361359 /DNA_START=723 /DNA_END=1253 /DNA_ORIENTATION=-
MKKLCAFTCALLAISSLGRAEQGLRGGSFGDSRKLISWSTIRVHFHTLEVFKTPNDAGDREEWEMRFKVVAKTYPGSIEKKGRLRIHPKDQTYGKYGLDISLDIRFRSNVLWEDDKVQIYFETYGKEDDGWWDDKLPTCRSTNLLNKNQRGKVKSGTARCSGHGREYAVHYDIYYT